MQASTVLVVDGDRGARDQLITCLRFVGLEAYGAEGAGAARSWLETATADVIVVSDPLHDGDTYELLANFASAGERIRIVTIGIASAAANESRGAPYLPDAMLQRPIPVGRVVEHIESLIRVRREAEVPATLNYGELMLDVAARRVSLGEDSAVLGRTENRLLEFFMRAPDRMFSRAQLLDRLWPANVCVEERTIDVHILRLRKALAMLGCPDYVQTVRGAGYRFSLVR